MKKAICMVLCFILALTLPFAASAYSNTEDPVHYSNGTIDSENIHVLRSTVVEDNPAQKASSEEDIVYYGINQFNAEDFLPLTSALLRNVNGADGTASSASYIRLEFPGALPNNVYSDFVEYVITAGSSATLKINVAVWAPESYNLEIGIYNWTTAENWYVTKSGGSVSNFTKEFTNLTAGNYSVYIRNCGASSLTTGYMQYNLT